MNLLINMFSSGKIGEESSKGMELQMNELVCLSGAGKNNEIFDLSSPLNRDNCFHPYSLLKKEFSNQGFNLSTEDINSQAHSRHLICYNTRQRTKRAFLLLMESEVIMPKLWRSLNSKEYKKIFTWQDNLVDGDKFIKINFPNTFPKIIPKVYEGKKLAALIAGNKNAAHPKELYSSRIETIRWFEKYKPNDFDLFGTNWNRLYLPFLNLNVPSSLIPSRAFTSYRGTVESKIDTLKKYKFSICYENAKDIPGYITEKIFDSFFAGCVPVYWGANNITKHIPADCFIDRRVFDDHHSLYEYLANMPESEYFRYIEAIRTYLVSEKASSFSSAHFVSTIVKNVVNS